MKFNSDHEEEKMFRVCVKILYSIHVEFIINFTLQSPAFVQNPDNPFHSSLSMLHTVVVTSQSVRVDIVAFNGSV